MNASGRSFQKSWSGGFVGRVGLQYVVAPGERFGRNDFAIAEHRGRGIAAVSGDTEEMARRRHGLRGRIKRPRDAGAGREQDDGADR